MAQTNAKEVAKYLIKISNSSGVEITNLKLQKLLYYAQAWFVTLNGGDLLFDDPIEAWVLGPAIQSIFNAYREYKSNPINIDINDGSIDLSANIISFLDQVFIAYGQFSASELVQLTHDEEPWKKARNGLDMLAPSKNIISIESISSFSRGINRIMLLISGERIFIWVF
ncbi:MAG: SocA family protein, partial [Caldiserica bacterium]|nr:SocA family protein [Caldisericota bacterium]